MCCVLPPSTVIPLCQFERIRVHDGKQNLLSKLLVRVVIGHHEHIEASVRHRKTRRALVGRLGDIEWWVKAIEGDPIHSG
jgi:hypothetical protein